MTVDADEKYALLLERYDNLIEEHKVYLKALEKIRDSMINYSSKEKNTTLILASHIAVATEALKWKRKPENF